MLLKLVYLATKNIEKKWTSPLQNWALTVQQLAFDMGSAPLDLTRNPEKQTIRTEFSLPPPTQLYFDC
jgi:hypothetical protein